MEMHQWSIQAVRDAIRSKSISAVELATYFIARIDKTEPALAAYIFVNRENALRDARKIDERITRGDALPALAGVPISVKDLFDVSGLPSTYGGRHHENYIPSTSATVIRRLLAAGAIIIGKTNLHEYAYGTTTENPHFGNTKNPWNRAKIPGGSSGGSSVSVVSGTAIASLGTDTGGSVRIPASLTGHVGLKPTFGLVSKFGVFPLADSLDHVGPMTKSVYDAALLLDVMAGYDPSDPWSRRTPIHSYLPQTSTDSLQGVRLGIPRQFFFDRCHTSVLQVIHQTLQSLVERGAQLVEIDIPDIHEVPDAQTAIIASEALEIHRDLLKRPQLYGADVLRRLEAGKTIPGADLVHAERFRTKFRNAVTSIFGSTVDFIVTPTTPLTATDIGQTKAHIKAHEVNVRGHLTRYTNPWNLTGLPAISLPCGLSSDGLPVGLQLIGSAFSERHLLEVSSRIEKGIGWDAIAPGFRD